MHFSGLNQQEPTARDLSLRVQHHAELLSEHDRRITTISGRINRLATRHRDLEMRVTSIDRRIALAVEVAKWIGFMVLLASGAWERLPEPLRSRLLGN